MNRLVNDCDTIKNGKIEKKSSNSEINRNLLEMKQEIINTQAQRIETSRHVLENFNRQFSENNAENDRFQCRLSEHAERYIGNFEEDEVNVNCEL